MLQLDDIEVSIFLILRTLEIINQLFKKIHVGLLDVFLVLFKRKLLVETTCMLPTLYGFFWVPGTKHPLNLNELGMYTIHHETTKINILHCMCFHQIHHTNKHCEYASFDCMSQIPKDKRQGHKHDMPL